MSLLSKPFVSRRAAAGSGHCPAAANVQTVPLICYTKTMLRAHRIWIVLILLSGCLGLPLAAPADPPNGYYDSVDSTDPVALRTTLHQVIDDHTRFLYGSA